MRQLLLVQNGTKMMKMDNNFDKYGVDSLIKWLVTLLGIGIAVYAIWYFRYLVFCIFMALVLSIVGRPLMDVLKKLKYKRLYLNKTICALLTLIIEISVIGLVLYLLIPLIISQTQGFANIDIEKLQDYYQAPMQQINDKLVLYNIISKDMDLQEYITVKFSTLFQSLRLPELAARLLSAAGSLIIGFFITAFITLFFLKDSHMLSRFIDNITPDKYLKEIHNIINNSRKLIVRYFLGVFCEILIMIILLGIGFSIADFPNAILCACICGIMVILPYIGVIIGGGIGLMIIITGVLLNNPSANILPPVLIYIAIFAGVKLIDDFLLQPLIYSKSVKAHPLEIFLVILMAGQIGGIIGMILAIPVYTFLRIIAKEFFSNWKFIKALTKEID